MAILTVNNIKKMFGTDVIIQDITFEVRLLRLQLCGKI